MTSFSQYKSPLNNTNKWILFFREVSIGHMHDLIKHGITLLFLHLECMVPILTFEYIHFPTKAYLSKDMS